MEFFVPDTEFEKADFKGVQDKAPPPREQAKTQREVVNLKRQDAAPSRGLPDRKARGSRPGKDITEIMGGAPKKPFEPEARSYRLRDSKGNIISSKEESHKGGVRKKEEIRMKSSPSSPRKAAGQPAGQAGRTGRSSRPKSASELQRESLHKIHAPNAFQPARLTREELQRGQPQKASSKAAPPLSSELGILGESVLLNLSGARHVLRRWYWEKEGQADPRVAFIPPHDRIHIALKLCGMPVLQKLFATMSPKEREQMVEILKQPLQFPPGYGAAVQTAFMQAMSEQGDWS